MSKTYTGFFAPLRRWNHRRLENRRLRREILTSLAYDDAAIMEAIARMVEEARAEAAARAADHGILMQRLTAQDGQLEGLGSLRPRLEAVERRLGALDPLVLRPEVNPAALDNSRREALDAPAAPPVEGLASPAAPASPLGSSFPTIATARIDLLEPELAVLASLARSLCPGLAIDVGANTGRFSRALLDLGFQVHALEPNPDARAELVRSLGGRPGFTVHACAAGAEEGEGTLGLVVDRSGFYGDATLYSSLSGLPLPSGLERTGSVAVPVRRLDALLRENHLPLPALIKIDTEGTDLEVLRGLGELWPRVVQAEFWDEELPFSAPGAQNRLPDLVAHARAHGARFHLVVFRRWGDDRPAYYSGWTSSPERSWGNVLFFTEQELFDRARQQLGLLIPEAWFVPAPTR